MKSRVFKTSVGSLVFFLLVIAGIALIHPIFVELNGFLTKEVSKIVHNFEEKTDLVISYDSLSPSILSGINVRNIKLIDKDTKKDLVNINKATFSYRFRDLFSKNPVKAIKLLLLDGVAVEYDAVKDNDILENIKMLFGEEKESKKEKNDGKPAIKKITLAGKELNIGFAIQFKNIKIHYSDLKNDFLVSVKAVSLEKTPSVQDGVQLKTSGRIDFRTQYVKHEDYRKLFACGFDLSGILLRKIEGSSFLFKLSEINRADYTLSRMELLLNYVDSKLTFRTMKNSLPYSLFAEADFQSKQLSLEAGARNFDPLKLIKIKNSSSLYSKFSGSQLTGRFSASSSFDENTTFSDTLKMNVNGSLSLSQKVLKAEQKFLLSMSLANNILNIESFKADGKKIGFDLALSYDVKNNQPSGVFTVDHVILNNGGVLQTDIYIDPYKKGFMCFAPQLFMNDRSLTAIQLTVLPANNSFDFMFEFDDYSHAEYEQSGHVLINGSFLNEKSKVIQANASVRDMFLDSVLANVAFFLPQQLSSTVYNLSQGFSKYIFSDELYFSTDFKSFSFNSPYFLLANSAKEGELLTFSVDGSSQTISLTQLDLLFGNQSAHASAGVDFSNGLSDFNFYTDVVINSLPYSFSGSFSDNFLSISGDYNFVSMVKIDKSLSGSVEFSSLPLSFGKDIFSLSMDSSFSWTDTTGVDVEFNNFDITEPYGTIRIKPHFAFTGSLNKHGFVMDSLAYSDTASALEGKMNAVWNVNEGIFDSILIDLVASSLISPEKFNLNAEFRNPEKKVLDVNSLKNDFYVSAQGNLNSFSSAHFFREQNTENTINASYSVTGTLNNPFFTLNLQRSSVNFAGYPAIISGSAVFDDTGLSINDLDIEWGKMHVEKVFASFDPKNYSGNVDAELSGEFLELDFNIPLKAQLYSLSPQKNPSKNIIASIKSSKMSGSFFPTSSKLDLLITKSDNKFDIVSDSGNGIVASISDFKYITAKSGPLSPLNFELTGSVDNNQLDLSITNLRADMKKFCQTVSIPYVNFTAGTMAGALKITGITTDPEYTGVVSITKPEFYVPYISKKLFKAEKVFATAGQGHFIVKPTMFALDKNPVSVGLDIEFDRWGINYLDCPIQTSENVFIPIDLEMPLIHYKGYGGFDNFLIHMTPDDVTFTGKIIGEKADIEVSTNGIGESNASSAVFDYIVNLDLLVKNRVQILFNPLLRGVIVPDNSLKLFIDTRTGDFIARGEVSLRGGEIVWLNRNFYMKEGKVVFNESKELFDPRITVRAETRGRDEDNNQVTITLSANGQTLSQFNPRFTSSPAKSETEIMELLGQVISADAQNAATLAMAGGDYLMQATVVRGLENTLRELLNFDIFSIRTNFLQNAVKQSFDKNSSNKQITFGNFFDNSAVYVGKYFGSAMYVDALMHWSYDEAKVEASDSSTGLVLQPEFGLEMTSPFVNIRLGVAPDLEAIKQSLWMPSTSITLSWKHSF